MLDFVGGHLFSSFDYMMSDAFILIFDGTHDSTPRADFLAAWNSSSKPMMYSVSSASTRVMIIIIIMRILVIIRIIVFHSQLLHRQMIYVCLTVYWN